MKLKEKFYRLDIILVMFYGFEYWAIKKQHTQNMSVGEMRRLQWMSGNTVRDRIKNECIRKKLKIARLRIK